MISSKSRPTLTPGVRRARNHPVASLGRRRFRSSYNARTAISCGLACVLSAVGLARCGNGSHQASAAGGGSTATAQTVTLPGVGKPQVTVGDKNFTEQFVLGQLYYQALKAQGFSVVLNPNIGPTEVTMQALATGELAVYPEYLGTWNSDIAGYRRKFRTRAAAYAAGQRYALAHGLALLDPTPFSNTDAIGVTLDYATQNGLHSIDDLRSVAASLTLGAPPQFQQSPTGLPAIEQVYGVAPAAFKPLEIGAEYQALDQGVVQAADVSTTDAELLTGNYAVLKDPKNVFGWGNVVPVASVRALDAEGPAFAATINRVSALLTLSVMRQLNAAVDLSGQRPADVARNFLQINGLLTPRTS